MLIDTPQNLLYWIGGAFLLGWIVGKIGSYFGNRGRAKKRDPRDDRIRSLEAELRVARGDAEKAAAQLEEQQKTLAETTIVIQERDSCIEEHLEVEEQLRADLKDSVLKTRELRAELSERATENVKSEVKLREVETELSVAKASTDLIVTGVLDYTTEADTESDNDDGKPQVVKVASGD